MRRELLDRFSAVLSASALSRADFLLSHVESFARDDDDVVCTFPEGAGAFKILGPARLPVDASGPTQRRFEKQRARATAHAPAMMQAFLRVSAGIEWGEVGDTGQIVLHDGFSGTVNALGRDAVDAAGFGFEYTDALCAPIDIDSGDFYLFHPTRELLLHQTEGVVAEVTDTIDIFDVYFRELAFELKDVRVSTPFRTAFHDAPHRTTWLRPFEVKG